MISSPVSESLNYLNVSVHARTHVCTLCEMGKRECVYAHVQLCVCVCVKYVYTTK